MNESPFVTRAPKRLQLSRAKGYRKPRGAIVVARPSKWGNPFHVGTEAQLDIWDDLGRIENLRITVTAEMAVAAFRERWETLLNPDIMLDADPMPEDREAFEGYVATIRELRGHDLACWCPLDQPCHTDVLLELANR